MFAKKNVCKCLCSSDVKLDIYNREELKNSANVMGVIRGSVEPGEKDSALATKPHLGHGEEVTSSQALSQALWQHMHCASYRQNS